MLEMLEMIGEEGNMALNIKVLGPGCSKCRLLKQHVHEALTLLEQELPELEATLLAVTDYQEIMQYPVLSTPALVVNERVLCAGRVPLTKEILGWLRAAAQAG